PGMHNAGPGSTGASRNLVGYGDVSFRPAKPNPRPEILHTLRPIDPTGFQPLPKRPVAKDQDPSPANSFSSQWMSYMPLAISWLSTSVLNNGMVDSIPSTTNSSRQRLKRIMHSTRLRPWTISFPIRLS